MRVDSNGILISNMDETVTKEESGDLVTYDCYGDVLWRDRIIKEKENMSWSYSTQGPQPVVAQYLDQEAPKAIGHVIGVERALADQALGLARAIVAAGTPNEAITVNAYGSAFIGPAGAQSAQSLSLTVNTTPSPTPQP